MKITKYVHSCLLVETEGEVILVDPGEFSWQSGLVDVDSISRLDAVVITHEHFDHFNESFLQKITDKFPGVRVVSTPNVVDKLSALGMSNAVSDSEGKIEIFSTAPHAQLEPIGETPQNIAVHIDGRLTIGGDRHDLEESKEILALTVTAPWGSMREAVDMALKLKPRKIIPIHDWHWNETARQQAYERMAKLFQAHEIEFIKAVDGEAIELG